MSKQQKRLQKRISDKKCDVAPNLLNELVALNNLDSWDQGTLTRVDEIVFGLTGTSELDNPSNIIEIFARYDYELISLVVSSKNGKSKYANQIENLQKLHNSCLDKHKSVDGELIDKAASEKVFILLKSIYDKLNVEYEFSYLLINTILTHRLNIKDAEKLIKFYEVDIAAMWSTAVIYNVNTHLKTPFMSKVMLSICCKPHDESIDWLDFFIRQGMPLNASPVRENALNIILTHQSLNPGTPVNLELLEAVLQRGADVNTRLTNPNGIDYVYVFAIAAGTGDLEAIKLLLRYGAKPYLSEQDSINMYGSASKAGVLYICDLTAVRPDASDQEKKEYSYNVHIEIEKYLLERALGIAPKPVYIKREAIAEKIDAAPSAAVTDDWGIEAPVLKKKQSNKKQKQKQAIVPKAKTYRDADQASELDVKESGDDIISTNLAISVTSDVQASVVKAEALEVYISYKENIQNDSNVSEPEKLKHKFDALLLRNNIEALQDLLQESPELYGYSVSTLLNNQTSDNLAHDVLAYNPGFLQKFYNLKKQSAGSNATQDAASSMVQGIYEVESMFDKKVFIKLSDDIKSHLQLGNGESKLQKLKVISSTSRGENGIKFYNKAIKLKLGREDESAYATKQYIDNDGNIFIEFDELHNHEWRDNKTSKLETINVSSSDFDSVIHGHFNFDSTISDYDAVGAHHLLNDEIDIMGDV